jgi:hypothetical protein
MAPYNVTIHRVASSPVLAASTLVSPVRGRMVAGAQAHIRLTLLTTEGVAAAGTIQQPGDIQVNCMKCS